jgi:hypothetical protein
LSGASWPHALYIHPEVAPFLRTHFGYHAAFFLGNYLFGQVIESTSHCTLVEDTAVEGWWFNADQDQLRPANYTPYLTRCGVAAEDAALISNTLISETEQHFATHSVVNGNTPMSVVCALRKLMSARGVVHTFRSQLGFWATAMLGAKGAFVVGIDQICINTSNSQQGSLWHTWLPKSKPWFDRTNSWFFVCGPNTVDARLYIE